MKAEAALIASRNLTDNVAAVAVSFEHGHVSLTYVLFAAASEEDEDERELTMAELLAAFPEMRTASSAFVSVSDFDNASLGDVIFRRD